MRIQGGEPVSVSQAKGIIRSLRWYHLGFCFFWAIGFTALSGSPVEYAYGYSVYSLCRQAITLVALCVAAVYARRHREFSPRSAVAAGVVLSAGSLLYYLTFFYGSFSYASALISGVFVGGAMGAFYVMWQSFFASEGSSRTTVYIPLSAAVSVVLCVLVTVIPFEWTVLCAVVVLPACATYTLYISLREIEPYEVGPMTSARSRMLLRDMWKPVFCVCAIGFVWRLVDHLAGNGESASFFAIMAGMSVATLAVSAVELFSDKGFDVLRVYQVLFPVVTGAFLLPTFLGAVWLPVASAFTMFGFEVVNLLLLITCAVYASRFAMHSSLVYATCVGPTLLALLVGDAIGLWLDNGVLYDLAFVVDILFVCIYVLAVALFVISVGRGRKREAGEGEGLPLRSNDGKEGEGNVAESHVREDLQGRGDMPRRHVVRGARKTSQTDQVSRTIQSEAESAPTMSEAADLVQAFEARFEEKLASLGLAEPLSPRETEVASLVLRGNTVAAIARKLFISENTVRGHYQGHLSQARRSLQTGAHRSSQLKITNF